MTCRTCRNCVWRELLLNISMKSHSRKWVCDRTWWRWRHWGRTCKVKPGTAGGNRRKGSPVRWCRHPRKWTMGVSLRRRQRPSKGCNTSSLYSKSVTSLSLHFFLPLGGLCLFSTQLTLTTADGSLCFDFLSSLSSNWKATSQRSKFLWCFRSYPIPEAKSRCESPATHFRVWKVNFCLSNSYAF